MADAVPGGSPVVAGIVLLVVALVGVSAGRAKRRWTLLVVGLLALAVCGLALFTLGGTAGAGVGLDTAAGISALYGVSVPLLVAFAAGWLCARGTLLRRLLVIGAAALLLAAFPYAAAGQATADALLTG